MFLIICSSLVHYNHLFLATVAYDLFLWGNYVIMCCTKFIGAGSHQNCSLLFYGFRTKGLYCYIPYIIWYLFLMLWPINPEKSKACAFSHKHSFYHATCVRTPGRLWQTSDCHFKTVKLQKLLSVTTANYLDNPASIRGTIQLGNNCTVITFSANHISWG